ncbi:MAG: methylated-DNA--[protein]-cysteine S-methyltransferase [Candidatus Micrarchaeota archaeon]|nr:methylated-DNA--[protein]-cysteine S-methyltransferase [Candidatus Micrarchaeota archaeon]
MDRAQILKELDRHGLTDFQKRVLTATMSVKKGQTITYKQLAKMAGHPNAYRAVGTALKLNPLPVKIPCHRVIKSNGALGNYSGTGGSRRKAALLKMERAKAIYHA